MSQCTQWTGWFRKEDSQRTVCYPPGSGTTCLQLCSGPLAIHCPETDRLRPSPSQELLYSRKRRNCLMPRCTAFSSNTFKLLLRTPGAPDCPSIQLPSLWGRNLSPLSLCRTWGSPLWNSQWIPIELNGLNRQLGPMIEHIVTISAKKNSHAPRLKWYIVLPQHAS